MDKREHIPAKLRHEVFKRDNYRCRECGATNKETTLEIDHIVPVSKGGSNNITNLQTLCKKCIDQNIHVHGLAVIQNHI